MKRKKILTLFYSDNIVGKLFSIAEIYENQDIIRNNRAQNWFWLFLNTVVAILTGVDYYKYYVYA